VLHQTLQDFSGPGTVFVGILVVTGVLHYGDLTGWSVVPLFHSVHGKLLLVKLALFAAMLGLAALHRWRVVPRLEGEVLAGGGSRSLQTLRLTVTIEATLAVLIIAAVSILGTLNPHG
jgi:putative copper resistance protein D